MQFVAARGESVDIWKIYPDRVFADQRPSFIRHNIGMRWESVQ